MNWAVETVGDFGSWAAFGMSGTVFGPVTQDEGLGDGSRPTTADIGRGVSLADPYGKLSIRVVMQSPRLWKVAAAMAACSPARG